MERFLVRERRAIKIREGATVQPRQEAQPRIAIVRTQQLKVQHVNLAQGLKPKTPISPAFFLGLQGGHTHLLAARVPSQQTISVLYGI